MSNERLENKCNECGRYHDVGNAQPKTNHVLYVKEWGTLQNVAIKRIADNPITSHLVFS